MPERLSLAERMDLANDPRMADPQVRGKIFLNLSPEDRDWIDKAMGHEHPLDVPGMLKSGAEAVGMYAKEHPAEVGGIAGGLAMMPATGGMSALPAMAMMGLGGAGGAGYGMFTSAALDPNSPAPNTYSGVAGELLKQGATQAGGEGVGRAIGATIKGGANAIQAQNLPKAINDEFPQTAEVLNRRMINPTTEAGATKAATLRHVSAERTQKLASDAEKAGVPGIRRRDLAPALKQAGSMAHAEADAGLPGGAANIKRRVDALFDPHGGQSGEIPISKAPKITGVLQREGMAARKAAQASERPSELTSVTADNLAAGVRDTTSDRIPGYRESNKETQGLIGADRAAAELKDRPLPVRMFGGPRALSSLGLGGATYGASGDPLMGIAAGTIPLALGVPQISAPAAIALYQAGRLPYAVLVKMVAPTILREAGITGEHAK